jgi:hypothetical protein
LNLAEKNEQKMAWLGTNKSYKFSSKCYQGPSETQTRQTLQYIHTGAKTDRKCLCRLKFYKCKNIAKSFPM